jgi:hypothetical protein
LRRNTETRFIDVSVPSQDSQRSCTCVSGIDLGFVVRLFVSRWQLVSEIIRRLNSVLPSTEPKMVSPDEKIELSIMQPLFPQGKLNQINARQTQFV